MSQSTGAQQFHDEVGAWLASHGFELIDEPGIESTQFRVSQATYKSHDGLSLQFIFNPVDGNFAACYFGRQWRFEDGSHRLSNTFSYFAHQLGAAAPDYYKLGYGDEVCATIGRIWACLKETLPGVVDSVTSDVIERAEAAKKGAKQIAVSHYGPEYSTHVEIESLTWRAQPKVQ